MSSQLKIIAFAGSTRVESFNKKLVKVAMRAAEKSGVEAEYIDLRDFPLPLYDGDLESEKGLPDKVKELKKLFIASQGFLIASPEYNSSLSAVLKNAIDWISRPAPEEAPLACFKDKFAAIMSSSPGALGGLRGLADLRAILGNIGVHVIPDQIAIGRAHEAFTSEGDLKDPKQQHQVEQIGDKLAQLLLKLHS